MPRDSHSPRSLLAQQLDSRLPSKWHTPIKARIIKPSTTFKKHHSPKRTHQKPCESRSLPLQEIDGELRDKLRKFQVLSRTLSEYFRAESQTRNTNTESILLAIKMIRAFTKTEIQEMSPVLSKMIQEMLASLPIPSQHCPSHVLARSCNHKRDFSFGREAKHSKTSSHFNLKGEIHSLQANLEQLREQGEVMIGICEEFQAMNRSEKLEYIASLRGIIEEQERVLEQLG